MKKYPKYLQKYKNQTTIPFTQKNNPLTFNHKKKTLTSPSSRKTISTSQNVIILK